MKHLCVIPARGGSKGLPRKNVLEIQGIPTIAYTIEAARESNIFDGEIYVISDDDEIMAVAREYGAKVPYREPDQMAGDKVSSMVPVMWVYDQLSEEGKEYDYIWNLQPTSPLRLPKDLRAASRTLENSPDADFLASVTPIDPHYFHWAVQEVEGKSGEHGLWFPDFLVERSELPDVYRPNGAIKVGRAGPLEKQGHVLESEFHVREMPEHRSIHIRSAFDRKKCEFIIDEYKEDYSWILQ